MTSGRELLWLRDTPAHEQWSCRFCGDPLRNYAQYMVWRPGAAGTAGRPVRACGACGGEYERLVSELEES